MTWTWMNMIDANREYVNTIYDYTMGVMLAYLVINGYKGDWIAAVDGQYFVFEEIKRYDILYG